MKSLLKPAYLPPVVLLGGVVTAAVRAWLFALGEDDRGLLAAGSIPDWLSWVCTAVMMIIIALGTWSLKGATRYSYNFPPSPIAAIGTILAGVAFLLTSVLELMAGTDVIGLISSILGILAALMLFALAYCRTSRLRLPVLFHSIVAVYLMFYLIYHYRLWHSYPQLQTYAFELLAIVFVMLACYHRAAFDADRGQRRAYTFFTLAALLLCVAALPGCENPTFFLGCAAWMLCTPCNLSRANKREE